MHVKRGAMLQCVHLLFKNHIYVTHARIHTYKHAHIYTKHVYLHTSIHSYIHTNRVRTSHTVCA